NSYAIQYYLVYGRLRMYLHLARGGVYMDAKAATSRIRKCFSLAHQIVSAVYRRDKLTHPASLIIGCSDFYGSYWSAAGQGRQSAREKQGNRPAEVLAEILRWRKRS